MHIAVNDTSPENLNGALPLREGRAFGCAKRILYYKYGYLIQSRHWFRNLEMAGVLDPGSKDQAARRDSRTGWH